MSLMRDARMVIGLRTGGMMIDAPLRMMSAPSQSCVWQRRVDKPVRRR